MNGLAERIGYALRWLSPTVARLTVGLVFFQSGWAKLHDLEKVTDYFATLGLAARRRSRPASPRPRSSSAAACCCSAWPPASPRFPLIITMCVAIRTALWDQSGGYLEAWSV